MANYVKSIDKKHMLTIGFEGFYGPSSPAQKRLVNPAEHFSRLGLDFIRNSKVVALDFTSVHIYPDLWLPVGTDEEEKIAFVSRWAASHIKDGHNELRKPVLFTEFGLSSKNRNASDTLYAEFYKHVFDLIYKSAKKEGAGSGSFIWQLIEGGMEEFGIVTGEKPSLRKLLKEQSCRLGKISHTRRWAWRSTEKGC
ncbi:Mannan endo-1,4-beta-mannosidase 5 [Platanthera guangdongensis]|uniref:mannan endo-1,4-beta-mannosidase n=1 Tax=Platanthera guangdongensis TaxID=2320717 RepID=A0ABR2N0C4_9ASPA